MDYDLSRIENWPSRCSYVLKELLETERVYVHDLGDVVKVSTLCLLSVV